ncbi:hypothetical protein IHE61_31115 [Streptomyces sp. GKU 257-1]|nr:hypothetical protein [Streptomyces sp. GKU 257-1]
MPWNFMHIELTDTGRIEPLIGPGDLTRTAAHAAVQDLLDRGPSDLAPIADTWRQGAKDDTVHAGRFVWTIYQHDGEDPTSAAVAWLEDFVRRINNARPTAQQPHSGPDPQDVIRRCVVGTVPGTRYPRPLPDALAPWYCYTADGGHSIAVALSTGHPPTEDDILPHPSKPFCAQAGPSPTDTWSPTSPTTPNSG